MTLDERRLEVLCDGLSLSAGACLPDTPRGLVVFLHGIPSVGAPDPEDAGYPGLTRDFAQRGFVAAWADMRAVRGSPGYFSMEGWVRDATAVVEAARRLERVADLKLALVGSSAGGAVATEAVRRGAPVDALVLLAAPADWISYAADAGAGVARVTREAGMPLAPAVVADPTEWAAEFERVATVASIAEVSVPILIVHGSADDVVPVEHAYRIAERAPQAELHILEGAGHQLRREPAAIELVVDWLERVVA